MYIYVAGALAIVVLTIEVQYDLILILFDLKAIFSNLFKLFKCYWSYRDEEMSTSEKNFMYWPLHWISAALMWYWTASTDYMNNYFIVALGEVL